MTHDPEAPAVVVAAAPGEAVRRCFLQLARPCVVVRPFAIEDEERRRDDLSLALARRTPIDLNVEPSGDDRPVWEALMAAGLAASAILGPLAVGALADQRWTARGACERASAESGVPFLAYYDAPATAACLDYPGAVVVVLTAAELDAKEAALAPFGGRFSIDSRLEAVLR